MTPTPEITSTATSAVVEAAPWWGVPLLAGLFAILGAVVAFSSTYLSDRRKMSRDDQRQWDKEIRDAYVTVAQALEELRHTRYAVEEIDAKAIRNLYDDAVLQLDAIDRFVAIVEVIGQAETVAAALRVRDSAREVASPLHDGLHAQKEDYRALFSDGQQLLEAVKANLRLSRRETQRR